MNQNIEEVLWATKYRPNTIEECILPPLLKKQLSGFAEKEVVNAIFSGPAGTGKTTAAMAIAAQTGADLLFLNGSGEDRGVDTVRNKILNFATKISLDGEGRKIVIFDEADNLTQDAQLALRSTIESVSKNCAFLLTCNFATRLIEPLHSRCPVFDFRIPTEDKADMFKAFCVRLVAILKNEGVVFDKDSVVAVVKKFFPDYRRILTVTQAYTQNTGKLDSGIAASFDPGNLSELIGFMKEKKFTEMRAWVTKTSFENSDIIVELYRNLDRYFAKESQPEAILHLNDGQKDSVVAVDPQLALAAMLTKLMFSARFN